jgi:hypothetical protein
MEGSFRLCNVTIVDFLLINITFIIIIIIIIIYYFY